MGLYNYHIDQLPEPLNKGHCFICDRAMQPYNTDPEMDAFQYKCNYCNPDVIIEISGSLLASSYYQKVYETQGVRQNILSRIKQVKERRFSITTFFASKYFI